MCEEIAVAFAVSIDGILSGCFKNY